jgi:hypothetical protein
VIFYYYGQTHYQCGLVKFVGALTVPKNPGNGYRVGRWKIELAKLQDSRHGWKVLGWSGVGFDLGSQDEVGAGVAGVGGSQVLTEFSDVIWSALSGQ